MPGSRLSIAVVCPGEDSTDWQAGGCVSAPADISLPHDTVRAATCIPRVGAKPAIVAHNATCFFHGASFSHLMLCGPAGI